MLSLKEMEVLEQPEESFFSENNSVEEIKINKISSASA